MGIPNEFNREHIDVLKIESQERGDIYGINYTTHRDGSTGHFYVPVYKFPDIERRVLDENWNLEDVKCDGGFQPFVEVNGDLNKKIIKVVYSNEKYKWISLKEWQEFEEYKNAHFQEINIAPYFYIDEYGQNLIAGQLKFLCMRLDYPLYSSGYTSKIDERTIPTPQPNKSVEVDRVHYWAGTDIPITREQHPLLGIIESLGLTPKEAIKILIEEV